MTMFILILWFLPLRRCQAAARFLKEHSLQGHRHGHFIAHPLVRRNTGWATCEAALACECVIIAYIVGTQLTCGYRHGIADRASSGLPGAGAVLHVKGRARPTSPRAELKPKAVNRRPRINYPLKRQPLRLVTSKGRARELTGEP